MGLFDTSKDVHLKTISKGVSLINRFIRSRVMAETPKIKNKKMGVWFFVIKGQIFNIFKNGKKLHTLQLHTFSVYELQ